MTAEVEVYKPKNYIRVVTATSLFDGHDAAINILRRILQDTGVEVIHLGHNRSVQEIVVAAIEEDAQGVAVSSYQGGHVEFFKYMVDLLKEGGASHIKVFGGGGVIVPDEIKELEAYGVSKIYSPEDGTCMGLQGMINHMVETIDFPTVTNNNFDLNALCPTNPFWVAKLITAAEQAKARGNGNFEAIRAQLLRKIGNRKSPVIGITGTGGAGKSSLTDELILRMLHDLKDIHIAIISCDPSRRKTGGALLGDRIRMNAISNPRVYLRSLATRRSRTELPAVLTEAIEVTQAAGYDLIVVETAGIGQGDSRIADLVDLSIYVMTSEFGAATQLEKIDMLDFADLVVINKFEKRGGEDAVRDVREQVQRNQKLWDMDLEEMPVFGTIASKFNDDGVTSLYHAIFDKVVNKTGVKFQAHLPRPQIKTSSSKTIIIPPERIRYLSEIADTVRKYHEQTGEQAQNLRKVWHFKKTSEAIGANDETEDSLELISKLKDEEPTRMFAGQGDPARTNQQFKMLSADYKTKRLSTAYDSVTLYGCDPDKRPDIYWKIGTSGVSICTLDDVKVLYDGFDLCAPNTSVAMTINGPAPMMLAMFFNAAIDQQVDKFKAENGKAPSKEQYENIRADVISNVRGTVQADILKEDQGQNTCIFSIEFALRMMGDIQQYFIDNNVRNYYSASISGYHIAEAGANPITQLALTLANGFTYVEYYLSRRMPLESFAPNFSFFFSNGMDPEYTIIGRVARRIWAIAMRKFYGGSVRSQMLKYNCQTTGQSLHSQDIQFNDIRTTLQALCALYDNCNSFHTNTFDEAITTPSAESVRRVLAIQLIINREWGLTKNENMNQESFIIEELTNLVEKAVLNEFDQITKRGGVLGAMETGYQRSKIQEESIYSETLKHSGELPIIGVNTFRNPDADLDQLNESVELSHASEEEKQSQLKRLADFKKRHEKEAPTALERLQKVALSGENIFAELMNTVQVCSLGQITQALYDVGGQYRRGM